MKDPYAEIELQIARTIDYLTAVTGASDEKSLGALHSQILMALNAQMELLYAPFVTPDSLSAGQVSLQLLDENTGRMYTRALPLDYQENSNGLTLEGEDASGAPAKIVFLSDTAMEKITDITGQGPDQSRCGDGNE